MLTTAQLAAQLGVTARRVLAIAAARRVAPAVDLPRCKLWRPAQAKALERRKPGRPRRTA